MKITGIIIAIIGVFYLLGAIIGGHNPLGGIIWTVIGGYLISRANKKKQEKEDRDKWLNGEP